MGAARDARGFRADQILTSPLFRLQSTRDPQTRAAIETYTSLAWREERTLSAEERANLKQASDFLKIRLPSPGETEKARVAFETLQSALDERLRTMPEKKKAEIVEEIKVQLREGITESRRPS